MRVLQKFGIHPLVAFTMVCIDTMLFLPTEVMATAGAPITEGFTLVVSELILVLIAIFLTIPAVLLQKYHYKDCWGVALGKGFIVGLLTAIPTPLPSLMTGALGVIGATKMLSSKSKLPPERAAE